MIAATQSNHPLATVSGPRSTVTALGEACSRIRTAGMRVTKPRVALVEKNALGGDCLYTGCVPSKTLIKSAKFAHHAREAGKYGFQDLEPRFLNDSFASITNHVQNVIEIIEHHDAPEVFEKMGVEVVFGSPKFLDPNEIEVALKNSNQKRGRQLCGDRTQQAEECDFKSKTCALAVLVEHYHRA